MSLIKVVKMFKEKDCIMCGTPLKNKWCAEITFPIILFTCGDCAYVRKAYLNYLRSQLPVEISSLKNLGVSLCAIKHMQ